MQVIATAGHVDHGKSALVRALTGMEPDRWAEERRRGLTIDLGFAWMTLPGGDRVAFVDVPGHERFVPNMLAGVGPVPAVVFVVAADGGWMPQSAEHLAAIDAVGIRHGLLAVTRCDLADAAPATRQALGFVSRTSLGPVEAVAVSTVTGAGLPELRAALARLVMALPAPDPAAPVRLWVDRSFSIRGSGAVVTGTLPARTVTVGQELLLTPSLRPARIRAVESLNEPVTSVAGVARVAVNLRGVPADVPARGMALIDAGRWTLTKLLDVRLSLREEFRLPAEMILHIGSARTLARIRLLGDPGHDIVRLTLRDALALHVGDRVLLRNPGGARPAIWGATVLDVAPPALTRRGAAGAAGRELAAWPDLPSAADLLRRHGFLRASALAAMGVPGGPPPVAGDWLADPARWTGLRSQLAETVAAHAKRDPLAIGMPPEAARAALGLPDRALVEALARLPAGPADPAPVQFEDGYLRLGAGPAPRGAGQLAEADGGQEGPVVVVALATGIGALQPGVVEQSADLGQAKPVGGLPEQPGPDPAAAVGRYDVQIADIGPPAMPGQPLSRVQGLQLDIADHVLAEHGGQAAAVDPDRTADRQPRQRRGGQPGQILDPGQVDDLGVPGVGEAGPPVQHDDVRPLLGHSVHAGHGQFAARVLPDDAPDAELGGTRVHQRVRRPGRVGPIGIAGRGRGPVEHPMDVPDVAGGWPGPFVGEVPEQMRRGDDPVTEFGHQGDPLTHPGVLDKLPGLAFQRAQDGVHGRAHTGHHGLGVGVDKLGELVAVAAAERPHLDR
jgi:selenocysteine-specific elongation factor